MTDPRSVLTIAETTQLRDLVTQHARARESHDYATADVLRTTLMAWGAWPPENGWHPVMESPAHRWARLEQRETSGT